MCRGKRRNVIKKIDEKEVCIEIDRGLFLELNGLLYVHTIFLPLINTLITHLSLHILERLFKY